MPMAQKMDVIDRPTQALLLILSLEEDAVSRVLRCMTPESIRTLHRLARGDFNADNQNLSTAYRNFLDATREPILAPGEGEAYIEKLAQRSLGREEGRSLFRGKESRKPFEGIEKRSAQSVADVLSDETPQVIAAILAEMAPEFSSSVITLFERELQSRVITKLANLGEVPGKTIDDLCRAVEQQLDNLESSGAISIDGMGRAASILQRMPIADTDEVLTSMGEDDPGMAHKLRRAMFSFEDLVNVQGRGMQMLIKEISNDQLLMALKTASDGLRDKILGAVSKRAAEILLDDLAAMGPMKLSEVEQAQQEIVDTGLRLEAESKIVIAGRGGEELV